MEALRWLFLDPQYVLEAVQQANRLAVKLLSAHRQSLRISPIRAIVSDYIPFDAVAVGEALLQLRRDALDDEQAQVGSQCGHVMSFVDTNAVSDVCASHHVMNE